jgi:hypothetical protein
VLVHLHVLDARGRELQRRQPRGDGQSRQGEPCALGTHQAAPAELDERTRDGGRRAVQAAAQHEGRGSAIEPGELEQGAQHARFVGRQLHAERGTGGEDRGGLLVRHAPSLAYT